MTKHEQYDISVSKETLRALETLATHEGKTLDGLMRDLITSYLKLQAAKAGKAPVDEIHDHILEIIESGAAVGK
ncbi:hypothetical protein KBA41_15285 [Candidatus Ozemobacteraceae bacterium]|nr:hypothetical protein [Candidatus Ozemobacteraceae bacterium]